MRTLLPLLILSLATPALAQTRPGEPYPQMSVGERHRYEMDRLRAVNDGQAALARQQAIQAQLTVLQLEAARQPAPPLPSSTPYVRSPEDERAEREAATARREATRTAVGQIDDWLDRGRQQPR
ncbi:MAG: hypothetical protein EON91_01360 [Brevundimonas sp.]|uniref:hypothetical protein n=1 Tax=Brevundimonas sp. TaxID=1871086 RepID=UPI0012090168|nr:hypothetical protein [Brevundimonas sp.]RZJ19363.1 MAG: hypothetical protein EON91_01360 [Brevundimonas sp.]